MKKQSEKGSHANINDWSSDDSADAERAMPLPDHLDPMSDSEDNTAEAAAAAAAKAESASAGKRKKQQADQLSAGRKKSKGGRSSSKAAGKHGDKARAHAKHAKVNDWTSDDSSESQPQAIADQLEPMSDSDADVQEGDRPAAAAASERPSKQRRRKDSDSTEAAHDQSPQKHEHGRTAMGNSGGQADVTVRRAAQHAKRKGRLRKASASPVQAQAAAAADAADDIMVDLEDDIPEVVQASEGYDGGDIAAARSSEDELLNSASFATDADKKRMKSSQSAEATDAARQSNKEDRQRRDKRQDL